MYSYEVHDFIFKNGNIIDCLSDSVMTVIECKGKNLYAISSNGITVYGDLLTFNRITGIVKIYREDCGVAALVALIPYLDINSIAIKNKSTIERIS